MFFSTELGFSTPQKTEAFSLVNHGPYKLQKTLRLPTFCVLKKKIATDQPYWLKIEIHFIGKILIQYSAILQEC